METNRTYRITGTSNDIDLCTIGGNCGEVATARVLGWITVGRYPHRDIRTTRSVCGNPVHLQIARMQVRDARVVQINASDITDL